MPGVDSDAVPALTGQGEGRAVPGKTGAPYKEEKGESTKGSICPLFNFQYNRPVTLLQ
jgi:hypothetical protein